MAETQTLDPHSILGSFRELENPDSLEEKLLLLASCKAELYEYMENCGYSPEQYYYEIVDRMSTIAIKAKRIGSNAEDGKRVRK